MAPSALLCARLWPAAYGDTTMRPLGRARDVLCSRLLFGRNVGFADALNGTDRRRT